MGFRRCPKKYFPKPNLDAQKDSKFQCRDKLELFPLSRKFSLLKSLFSRYCKAWNNLHITLFTFRERNVSRSRKMLIHHLYKLYSFFLLFFVVLKVLTEIEKILKEIDSRLKRARLSIMSLEYWRIDLNVNIFLLYLRIPPIFHLSKLIILDDSLEKLIRITLKILIVLNILIQSWTLYVFIMLSHILHQFIVILDNWFQHRDFCLTDVFLDRLHVEVIEMCEVEI